MWRNVKKEENYPIVRIRECSGLVWETGERQRRECFCSRSHGEEIKRREIRWGASVKTAEPTSLSLWIMGLLSLRWTDRDDKRGWDNACFGLYIWTTLCISQLPISFSLTFFFFYFWYSNYSNPLFTFVHVCNFVILASFSD